MLRDVVFISNEIIASGRFDLTDSGLDHQRGVPRAAQRAPARLQVAAEPGGVLGRALDQRRRVPVHQERRLRARPARPRRLHRLRARGHEGADEGRHHRACQAAHRARPLHRHHRARASSPPSRPNPIVTQLAIMPDIEKRLEAFVRMAHGIVVFPGGAGTAEEILYLAGILLDPANRARSRCRWCSPDRRTARRTSSTIAALHRRARSGRRRCGASRSSSMIPRRSRGAWCAAWMRCASSAARQSDSYNFNWLLAIRPEFQQPFEVTHASDARAEAASAASPRTSSPRICAAPSPASLPAT